MRQGFLRILGLVPAGRQIVVRRHAWPVRLGHALNAVCLFVLVMSGLQIFNAHPALYWGTTSDFDHPIFAMTAVNTPDGFRGITTIGTRPFDTTGWFGVSEADGETLLRGFPAWATLPGPQWLAMGRLWHFAFAWIFVLNGLAFLFWAIRRGHLVRDLMPRLSDLKHLPQDLWDHLRLRFPQGETALRYNPLQKIAYFTVLCVLGPLVVATGLTMSPTMDAAMPWLPWLFGGRQTARTIHFLCAFSFLAFFAVHMAMVLLSGPWNQLVAIVTGRYRIASASGTEPSHD